MSAGATIADPLAAVGRQRRVGSVASKDGTVIGFHQLGHGPGLVILHGAVESALSHLQLAEALADAFTVYLPDRRGRGMSGPYGSDHTVRKDVEDVDALLQRADAHYVFRGQLGRAHLARGGAHLPAIHKAAIFEPPLNVNGSVSTAFLPRYDAEIAAGDTAAALVTGMKAAQMGPPIFNVMPRWLLEQLTRMMMSSEDKRALADDGTMRKLAPTLHYDVQPVIEVGAGARVVPRDPGRGAAARWEPEPGVPDGRARRSRAGRAARAAGRARRTWPRRLGEHQQRRDARRRGAAASPILCLTAP